MAYFLFVDESGRQDHRESPHEVLAGTAVHDTRLWRLICQIREAELKCFGMRYGKPDHEIKAKNILKRKTFRLAGQAPTLAPAARAELTRDLLTNPVAPTTEKLAALGQARIAFVIEGLELTARSRVCTFAGIVKPDAPRPPGERLSAPFFVHSDLTTGIMLADLVAFTSPITSGFGACRLP